MIRTENKVCAICGKAYIGSYKTRYCCAACRLEAAKRSNEKYRHEHQKELNAKAREARAKERSMSILADNEVIISKNPRSKISDRHLNIPLKSEWAIKYKNSDRLEKIAMLCSALDYYGIGLYHYGYMSAIYLSQEYYSLLLMVLQLKEKDRRLAHEVHT